MPTPLRTPDGKWVIFERATGQRLERWPVDAREQVTKQPDDYTYDPPEGHVEPPPAPPEQLIGDVSQLSREHSPGVPLVTTAPHEAGPATPIQLPTGRSGGARQFPK